MIYEITDDCTSCGTCVDECPVQAISEGDGKYVISKDTCTGCGACVEVCPVSAIVPGEE
jgi:ferredoxin